MRRLSSEKVRERREGNWMTQQEVAAAMGVSLFTVQRIERGEGNVRSATARALARVLKVTPDELLVGAYRATGEEAPTSPAASEAEESRGGAVTYLLRAWQRYVEAETRALDGAVERGEADLGLAEKADQRDERIWSIVGPDALSRVLETPGGDSGTGEEATRYEMLVEALMEHTSAVARAYDAVARKGKGSGAARGDELARRRARRKEALRALSENEPEGAGHAVREAAGAQGGPRRPEEG